MIAKRIRVSGRVQGVFYRASTKEVADRLQIAGWVRNEPDGAVLMEVEGAPEKVLEMINWCKQGPTYARVDELSEEDVQVRNLSSFDIRY